MELAEDGQGINNILQYIYIHCKKVGWIEQQIFIFS
jgi:hypothetical protein